VDVREQGAADGTVVPPGLTQREAEAADAADPVFRTVLPALVIWFALLSAAYRLRLLERALGLAQ
jgi:multisubunit Na+/H+ antiporter MnhC subunit